MSDIKWIKIVTDIFDDEKIKLIENMPDADALIVIWFKILCLAGRTNKSGLLMLNDKIHFNDEMLSSLFNRPYNTVRMGLDVFQKFGMIEIINDSYYISNWEKHQNIDGLDKIREQSKKRMKVYREKLKLSDCYVTSNVTVTRSYATEEEEEKDKELDIEEREEKEVDKYSTPYEDIKDLYNIICGSNLSTVKFLSESRKRAIKTAWNKNKSDKEIKINIFRDLFTKAVKSKFLTGTNDRGWRSDFDWLLKEKNMVKVLEGNYDNRSGNKANSNFNNFESRDYDFDDLEEKLLNKDKDVSIGSQGLTMDEIKDKARTDHD